MLKSMVDVRSGLAIRAIWINFVGQDFVFGLCENPRRKKAQRWCNVMAGREVREYTNLSDPKDKKWGSQGGKDKIDDEDLAFKRMVAKMQEVAGERGGYLHGRGALDSDDLLYLKEQMEAEEDAERLRRRTEKRAFAAFKISLSYKAASLADASPLPAVPPIRVEPKPRSGIRQQDLLKSIVEVKPKRQRLSGVSEEAARGVEVGGSQSQSKVESRARAGESISTQMSPEPSATKMKNGDSHSATEVNGSGLLGLAYETSDEEDEESEDPPSPSGSDASASASSK
ncbi:hypothetical protein R1flu_020109 [Riccia fluitans]|uniref:Uncharacterized protein n=1 Tax=Riccia fluitans TaxID=41844 RepID=A0ABD1ZMR7_9MARC